MKRIFLTLAVIANCVLVTALFFGLWVGDPNTRDLVVQQRISTHMLIGLGALTFATLVHAILFTYFMGTGRWLEETSRAYSLDQAWHSENQRIKYGTLPGMVVCLLLLITTGALGAAADPATPVSLDGFLGMSGSTIHFTIAITTASVNLIVNIMELIAIHRNGMIIEGVLAEVRRIRLDRGLPVE
ncbi:MAG: hypothetical protein JNL58_27370 [Planctomyces sp.]|nr:hypothetical protein [Planctomyces sp.]